MAAGRRRGRGRCRSRPRRPAAARRRGPLQRRPHPPPRRTARSSPLEEFQNAIKQDAKNPYFHKGLGLAYATAEAGSTTRWTRFRKALELNPYYTDVRNDLGMALILSGQARGGQGGVPDRLQRPHQPDARRSRRATSARPTSRRRTTREAANWFRSSLNRNKAYPDAYLGLADALVAASAAAEDALTHPGDRRQRDARSPPAILLALGEAYYRAGRFARRAGAARGRARKKDPDGAAGRRAARAAEALPQVGALGGARSALPEDPRRAGPLGARRRRARSCSTPRARSWSRRARGDYRHRLIGAYQGIALAVARRIGARHGAGAVDVT